jgi:AraC-like DNA-binding protein
MKNVETTGPIDHIRNEPICTEGSTHAGLWKAKRLQFQVIRCHACELGPAWDSGGRTGCDYLHHIDMVTAGRAQVVHDGNVLDLEPGHAYFLPGNVPVARRCRRSYEVYYVAFRCEWFPGIDVLLDWPERRPLCLGRWDPKEWADDFTAGRTPSLNTLLKLQSQIGLWVAGVATNLEAILAHHIRIHSQFERVFEYVERNLRADLRVASLSRVHGKGLQAFSLAFTRALGIGPKEYIDRRLNEEIIRRLITTAAPMKRIAADLGFADEYAFNRYCSRMNGMPPSRYRRHFLGEPAAKPRRG